MTPERLAELSAQDFIYPHTNDELLAALIAERAEVERLSSATPIVPPADTEPASDDSSAAGEFGDANTPLNANTLHVSVRNHVSDYGHDEAMRDLAHISAAYSRAFREAPSEHVAHDNLADYIERLEAENARLQALTDTLAGKHPDAAEMLFRERKLNETLLEMQAERDALRKVARAAMEGDDGCCSCCIYQSTAHDKDPCVSCGLRLALAEWEATR
jgi:hypothetical protein